MAFIGATGESYSAIGFLAAEGLVGSMTSSPPATIGEWWINVQNAIASEPPSSPLPRMATFRKSALISPSQGTRKYFFSEAGKVGSCTKVPVGISRTSTTLLL